MKENVRKFEGIVIGEKSILRVLKMDYYRKCGSRFTKESDFFFFFNRIVGGAFNDAKNKGKRNGKHSRPGSRVYTDKQMEKHQPFRFNKETAGRSNDILFSEIYPAFSGKK